MSTSHDNHHHWQQQQHQDSLQIKQNDKFYSRVMSKETSMANSSSRVYYRGASGSVPFMWESQPGTPKHTFHDTSLPPLIPPPSYLSGSSGSKTNQKMSKNMNGSKFLATINVLPRFVVNKKKKDVSPSSSWSSTSSSLSSSTSSNSSSSLSWPPSSSSCCSFSSRSRFYNYDHDGDHEDHQVRNQSSSSSALCFGVKARSFNGSSSSSSRGRYSMVKMKNALLSIVGHGSSAHHQGTTA